MGDSFMNNHVQAKIAHWLKLPHRLLSSTTAHTVAAWKEHAVADFQEMFFAPTITDTQIIVFVAVC